MKDGFILAGHYPMWFGYLCQMRGRLRIEITGLRFRDSTLQHLKATGVIKGTVRTKKDALAIVEARVEGMKEAKQKGWL